MVILDSASEFGTVADDVGNEKMAKFWDISLVVAPVVQIIVFFPFLKSAGDRDMATQVEWPISKCWGVVVLVWVPVVAREGVP